MPTRQPAVCISKSSQGIHTSEQILRGERVTPPPLLAVLPKHAPSSKLKPRKTRVRPRQLEQPEASGFSPVTTGISPPLFSAYHLCLSTMCTISTEPQNRSDSTQCTVASIMHLLPNQSLSKGLRIIKGVKRTNSCILPKKRNSPQLNQQWQCVHFHTGSAYSHLCTDTTNCTMDNPVSSIST